jgi:hypothetical protein
MTGMTPSMWTRSHGLEAHAREVPAKTAAGMPCAKRTIARSAGSHVGRRPARSFCIGRATYGKNRLVISRQGEYASAISLRNSESEVGLSRKQTVGGSKK